MSIAFVVITMMALVAAIGTMRAHTWAAARARRREIARRRAALADAYGALRRERLAKAPRG